MSKLYAPYIDTKLPAFEYSTGNVSIKVPFEMNRTVNGKNEVEDFSIIVKTVSTNQIKVTQAAHISDINTVLNKGEVTFVINNGSKHFLEGQYYKVQIAYIDKSNNIGHYSTAAVVKCTGQATVKITNDLSQNKNVYSYTGQYENTDINEKVHYYEFSIYDSQSNLYATSGKIIHNGKDDSIGTKLISIDNWILEKSLIEKENYTIRYKIYTVNGLEIQSPAYTIKDVFAVIPSGFNGELRATMKQDDGYIEISMRSKDSSLLNGNYVLSRASSEDNYTLWHTLQTFSLAENASGIVIYRDFTVQQGIQYLYAVQLTNVEGKRSERILNKEYAILADFDDMFLFDGIRQLKVQFNPQVSSFKTTILETKTDTLGGQYPFFFRNGNVGYKEFTISGLLSILTDENHFFIDDTVPILDRRVNTPTWNYEGLYRAQDSNNTSLIPENFERERSFKMEVLNWLNNGQPKLFRSPGEGNYVVRLMNTSLSPNTTLGRMLHTFSSTAYEIADVSFESLKNLKFVPSPIENKNFGIISVNIILNSVNINPLKKESDKTIILPNNSKKVIVTTLPSSSFYYNNERTKIDVDITGIYTFPINTTVNKIEFKNERNLKLSSISFTYENTQKEIELGDMEDDIISLVEKTDVMIAADGTIGSKDLMSQWNYFKNNKTYSSNQFYYVEIKKRDRVSIIKKDGKYYSYKDLNTPIVWNKLKLYFVILDMDDTQQTNWVIDGAAAKEGNIFDSKTIDYTCVIKTQDNFYNCTPTLERDDEMISLYNLGVITSFMCGNGVRVNVGYQQKCG